MKVPSPERKSSSRLFRADGGRFQILLQQGNLAQAGGVLLVIPATLAEFMGTRHNFDRRDASTL